MARNLEGVIDWEAIRADDPMDEVLNAVDWLNERGFDAKYSVTERDSFGPVSVLITAYINGEEYEYLY